MKKINNTSVSHRTLATLAILFSVGLMTLCQFSLTSALTYQSSVDVSFTFNPTISINLSSSNLKIDDLAPGTAADSNIITIGVTTNAAYGYNLSSTVGEKNGTSALTNTDNNSYTFTNLATTAGTATTLNDITADYWGYSYCADNATNCNNGTSNWVSGSVGSTANGYAGLPLDDNTNANERGKGGITLIATDQAANSDESIQFKIGASASTSQAAGDYTNVINFYAVANPEPQLEPVPCNPSTICYNANSLTAYEGTMGKQTLDDGNNDIVDGASVTLLASNFSRTGYGFAGWSDAYDYATNPNAHFYGPQEDITVPTGTTANGLALYAVWIRSQGNLQDSSKVASVCNNLTTAPTNGTANLNSVSALTDQRDNQTYAIAKLADGKCWMIENLRLESTNSDNATGALAQGYGTSATYGNFGGLADAESTGFTSTYSANSLYSNNGSNNTINIGTSNFPAYRMPRYNNLNTQNRATNPTSNTFADNNTTGGMYSYGNYYTWHAAIADLTYNGTNNQSTTGTSLCPAGWHLPKSGNKSNEANNEIWSLVVDGINGGTKPANYDSSTQPSYAAGTPEGSDASNKLRAYPNNFLYSGYFNTSSASNRGSYGRYWSSTASNFFTSYFLYLGSSNVNPGANADSKSYGRSIRCTAGS